MAKKPEPKPFYPLYHEFVESAQHFAQMAGMLADSCDQLLRMNKINGAGADVLRERLAAFNAARHNE